MLDGWTGVKDSPAHAHQQRQCILEISYFYEHKYKQTSYSARVYASSLLERAFSNVLLRAAEKKASGASRETSHGAAVDTPRSPAKKVQVAATTSSSVSVRSLCSDRSSLYSREAVNALMSLQELRNLLRTADIGEGKAMELHLGSFSRAASDQFITNLLRAKFPEIDEYTCTCSDSVAVPPTGEEKDTRRAFKEWIDGVSELIYAATDGNPLFMLEITKTAMAQSDTPVEMLLCLRSLIASMNSLLLDELIVYNFDQLSEANRFLLKVAAVINETNATFSASALSSVLGLDDSVCVQLEGPFKGTLTPQSVQEMLDHLTAIVSTSDFLEIATLSETSRGGFHRDRARSTPAGANKLGSALSRTPSVAIRLNTQLRFSSELKRSIIYDLMLTDQQQWLHQRTALHLEKQMLTVDHSRRTAVMWQQLGQQWQQAERASKAMACFYEAGLLMDAVGARIETKMCLSRSFNMLQAMKESVGMPFEHMFRMQDGVCVRTTVENSSRSRASSVCSDSDSDSQSNGLHADASDSVEDDNLEAKAGADIGEMLKQVKSMRNDCDQPSQTTQEKRQTSSLDSRTKICKIWELFQGDVLCLEVAVLMLVRFFQCMFSSTSDDILNTRLILGEALQLILLTSNKSDKKEPMPDVATISVKPCEGGLLSALLHRGLADLSGSSSIKLQEITQEQRDSVTGFRLRDVSVIFPVLSGFGMQFIARIIPDDDEYSNFGRVCEMFLSLALDYGDPVHIMRAWSFYERKHDYSARYHDAIDCISRIRAIYETRSSELSLRMIEVYGSDRAVQAIGRGVLMRLLVGDFAGAAETAEYVKGVLKEMKHLNSVGLTTFSLVNTFFTMNMFAEALECFTVYFRLDLATQGFSMFRTQNPFSLECLLRVSGKSRSEQRHLRESMNKAGWWSALQLISRDGCPVPTDRSQMSVEIQERNGIGCDCMKAHICLSEAKLRLLADKSTTESDREGSIEVNLENEREHDLPDSKGVDVLTWCRAGLSFAHASLAACVPQDLLFMNRIHCLWVTLEILDCLLGLPEAHLASFGDIDFESGALRRHALEEVQLTPGVMQSVSAGHELVPSSGSDTLHVTEDTAGNSDEPDGCCHLTSVASRVGANSTTQRCKAQIGQVALRLLATCDDVGATLRSPLVMLRTALLRSRIANKIANKISDRTNTAECEDATISIDVSSTVSVVRESLHKLRLHSSSLPVTSNTDQAVCQSAQRHKQHQKKEGDVDDELLGLAAASASRPININFEAAPLLVDCQALIA